MLWGRLLVRMLTYHEFKTDRSTLVGFFINRINAQLTIIGCLSCSIFTFGGAPWNTSLTGLAVTLCVNGFFLAIYDVGSNVWIMNVWGDLSSPFIQILHFMFGVGSILGPLLAKPFLVNDELLELSNNDTQCNSSGTVNNSTDICAEEEIMVQWPYLIVSLYTLVTVSIFAIVYFRSNEVDLSSSKVVDEVTDSSKINPKWRLINICISTVFCHFMFALELIVGSFLMTFVVNCDLKLDKPTGALMNSVFWFAFTVARLPGIYISKKFGLETTIIINLILTALANFILVPFGNSSVIALWCGLALIGED